MLSALEAEPSPKRCQLLLPLRKHISHSGRRSSEWGWDSRDFAPESPFKKPSCFLLEPDPREPTGHCLPRMLFHQVALRRKGLSSWSGQCVCGSALLITAACVFPVIKHMTNRAVLAA